jgi:hypothetical protein
MNLSLQGNQWTSLQKLGFLEAYVDVIGDALRFLGKGKESFIVHLGLLIIVGINCSIVARDEMLLEYEGQESIYEERKMLEKMLLEQPSPSLTLMDMCLQPLKEVSVLSAEDPLFEKFISVILD